MQKEPIELTERFIKTAIVLSRKNGLKAFLTALEQTIVKDALISNAYNKAKAARELKILRTTLVEKVRKMNSKA